MYIGSTYSGVLLQCVHACRGMYGKTSTIQHSSRICIYGYVYHFLYICEYIHSYMHTYVCTYLYIDGTCKHTYIPVHLWIYNIRMHVCISEHLWMYAVICVHEYIHTCASGARHTNIDNRSHDTHEAWMSNVIILSCEIRHNMKYGKIWRKCELVGNNRLVADSCMNNFESRDRCTLVLLF